MSFASPIWFMMLIPWGTLIVYLLLGQRRGLSVPFLELWRGPIALPSSRRSLIPPRAWVVLLLLAGMSAILAATTPIFRTRPAPPGRLVPARPTIESFTVRKVQAMVQIANDSPERRAILKIEGSNGDLHDGDSRPDPLVKSVSITLPDAGRRENYFVDLPDGPMTWTATLMPGGSTMSVSDRPTWPRLSMRTTLPDPVHRAIEIYMRHRPAAEGSMTVPIVGPDIGFPIEQVQVIFAPGSIRQSGPAVAADHALTAHVDWSKLSDANISLDAPREWRPIVTMEGHPIVAVRNQPAREVWIGFDSDAFARSPDFMILWTNVFDWLGEGRDRFEAMPLPAYPELPIRASTISLAPGLAVLSVVLSAAAIACLPRRLP